MAGRCWRLSWRLLVELVQQFFHPAGLRLPFSGNLVVSILLFHGPSIYVVKARFFFGGALDLADEEKPDQNCDDEDGKDAPGDSWPIPTNNLRHYNHSVTAGVAQRGEAAA